MVKKFWHKPPSPPPAHGNSSLPHSRQLPILKKQHSPFSLLQQDDWQSTLSAFSHKRHSREGRTDCVPTWHRRLPTSIRVLSVSLEDASATAMDSTTCIAGTLPSVHSGSARDKATFGAIISRLASDSTSISSFARI